MKDGFYFDAYLDFPSSSRQAIISFLLGNELSEENMLKALIKLIFRVPFNYSSLSSSTSQYSFFPSDLHFVFDKNFPLAFELESKMYPELAKSLTKDFKVIKINESEENFYGKFPPGIRIPYSHHYLVFPY